MEIFAFVLMHPSWTKPFNASISRYQRLNSFLEKKGKQNIFVVWTRRRAFIKFQFLNVRRIYALWKLKKDDTDSSDYCLDSSVPKVYLQAMSEFFGDLPEVFIYFDDFLVMGDTKEELETCGEFWYVVMNWT